MIAVYIKSIGQRAYITGFSIQDFERESFQPQGSLTGSQPGKIRRVAQKMSIPVALLVTEDGKFGVSPLTDLSVLEGYHSLQDIDVPADVLAESEELQRKLHGADQAVNNNEEEAE